jgi:hypothetical protein
VSSPLARRVGGRPCTSGSRSVWRRTLTSRSFLASFPPPSVNLTSCLRASDSSAAWPRTTRRSARLFSIDEMRSWTSSCVAEHRPMRSGGCGVLLPVLAGLEGPLALVEVGASAGLCLLLDRYRYRYGHRSVGEASASVLLDCEVLGPVPVPTRIPEIAWRRGIDVAPIDVTDDEDVRWLEACVWPDQTERIARLRAAVEVARREPPVVEQGDALERTADVVSRAPGEATVVVFHSALMPYLTEGSRRDFEELVSDLPVTWISNEGAGGVSSLTGPWIEAAGARGAFVVAEGPTVLGLSDPHGAWLEWIT